MIPKSGFRFSEKIVPIRGRENDWLRLTSDDRHQVTTVGWSLAMRRLLLAAAIFGAVQGAECADLHDLPILRGAFPEGVPTATVNWHGYYIGGQGGYGSSDENFSGAN